jgi:hypothetical protein
MPGTYPKRKPFGAPEPNGGGWTGAAIRGLQSLMPAGQPLGGTSNRDFYKPKSPHDFAIKIMDTPSRPDQKLEGGMWDAARNYDYPGARNVSQRGMEPVNTARRVTAMTPRPSALAVAIRQPTSGAMPGMTGPSEVPLSPPQFTGTRAAMPQGDPAVPVQSALLARVRGGNPAAQSAGPQPAGPYNTNYYAARRANGGQAPVAKLGDLLRRGDAAYAPQAAGQPPVMNSRQFAQANGYAFPQQPSQNPPAPAQTPLQRVLSGQNPTMNYSQSWDAQVSRDPQGGINKLMPASSREGILARLNQGKGAAISLEQAASDPNFNAAGNLFQGAKLGQDQNGRAFFREGPKPTDFAGSATNQGQADTRRLSFLKRMEEQGKGYVAPNGAFIGMNGERGAAYAAALRDNPGMLASRMAAGGYTTPTTLTPDQLTTNAERTRVGLAQGRAERMGRVTQLAQQRAAERNQPQQGGMNPMLANLIMRDPRAAVAALGMQQQGAIEQARLAQEGRQLDLQGRLAQDRLGLDRDRLVGEDRRFDKGLEARNADALAARQHELDRQAKDPMVGLRQQELEQQGKLAQENMTLQERLAQIRDGASKRQLDAENAKTQAGLRGGLAGKLLDQENLSPDQQAAIGEWALGQQQPAGAAGAPVPQGGIRELLNGATNARTFAGNTLSESQLKQVENIDDPILLRDKLRSFGLDDKQVTTALNAIKPPGFFNVKHAGNSAKGTRTAEDPGGWRGYWRGGR